MVPITAAKMKLDGPHSEMDQRVMAALSRNFEQQKTLDGPREIDLFTDDIKALENQRAFKARFGFVLGRRGRQAMFEVIDTYDLTDDEVKALHRVGCFDWDGHTLRVTGKKWIGLVGSLYLLMISIFSIATLVTIMKIPEQAYRVSTALWIALVILLLFGAWIYRLFIRPFRLFKIRKIND